MYLYLSVFSQMAKKWEIIFYYLLRQCANIKDIPLVLVNQNTLKSEILCNMFIFCYHAIHWNTLVIPFIKMDTQNAQIDTHTTQSTVFSHTNTLVYPIHNIHSTSIRGSIRHFQIHSKLRCYSLKHGNHCNFVSHCFQSVMSVV